MQEKASFPSFSFSKQTSGTVTVFSAAYIIIVKKYAVIVLMLFY